MFFVLGFPGETNEEFEITYNFLNKIKFYKMHIFKYSKRRGTKASLMKDQVSSTIKEERSKKLLELSDKNENEYLNTYINKSVEVLFEEKDEEGYYKGHTSNYLVVKVKSDENLCNKIQKVTVKKSEKLSLIAEIIK